MRAFKFRLDRVLNWYGNQFQLEQARLATLMAELHETQKRIARFQAERLRVEQDVIGRQEIPARDFPALGLYRLQARRTEFELGQEAGKREAAVQAQLQKVMEAQRKLRLLEKLRDRRKSEHQYQEDRELEILANEAFMAVRARGA